MPTPTTIVPRTKRIIESILAEKKGKAHKSGRVVAKPPGKVSYGKK